MDKQVVEMQNGAPEFPVVKELEWYALAVASACITAVLAAMLLLWVFFGQNHQMSERISIAGGIVAFGSAATTFFTVAWRGLINARQADTANEQIREAIAQGGRVERQLRATDINNQALLLEKAAVLIADDKAEKKVAGISLLRHIGIEIDAPFKREAIQVLKDFLSRRYTNLRASHSPNVRFLHDDIDYMALMYLDDVVDDSTFSRVIPIRIRNGSVSKVPSRLMGVVFVDSSFVFVRVEYEKVSYRSPTFIMSTINYSGVFTGECTFEECEVVNVGIAKDGTAAFQSCNFSGCVRIAVNSGSTFVDCFYYTDALPSAEVLREYGDRLEARERPI